MFSGHSGESSGWKWSWHSAARAWHKRKGAINNFSSINCIFVKQATSSFCKSKCFNQQHVLQPIKSLTELLYNYIYGSQRQFCKYKNIFCNQHQIDITGAVSEDLHVGRVGKNKETISCLLQTDSLSRPAQTQHHVRPVHQRQPHTVT